MDASMTDRPLCQNNNTNNANTEASNFGGASSPSGSRRSKLSEDFRVQYTDFEALPNFPPHTQLEKVFEEVLASFHSADWLDHFSAVDLLRVIGKFNRRDINLVFEAFGPCILAALASPKTCVVKNTLAFLHECCEGAPEAPLRPAIVAHLVPRLLARATAGCSILRPLAQLVLESLTRNCVSDEMLQALCEATRTSSSAALSAVAFQHLTRTVEVVKQSLAQAHPDTLVALFRALARVLEGTCAPPKQVCRRVVRFLGGLMGEADFRAYVSYLYDQGALSAHQGNLLIEATQEIRTARPSIALKLREGRKTGSIRHVRPDQQFININGVDF